MAKKKLDSLMKESKIRDREDPDSFTITTLPPAGKTAQKNTFKVKDPQQYHIFQKIVLTFTSDFTSQYKFKQN